MRSGTRFAGGRAQLSWANLRSTVSIVRARFGRRQRLGSRFSLPFFLFCSLGLLVAAAAAGFLVDITATTHLRSGPSALSRLSGAITDIGLSGWYLVPAALLLVIANQTDWRSLARHRLRLAYNWTCFAFFVLCAVGFSGIAVNILKYGIARARPRLFDEVGPFSFHPFSFDASYASFPSGHATTMGAVAGVIVLLYPGTRFAVIPVAFAVAISRVFVGAHYPSDVIAGFGLGFVFALTAAVVFARLGFIFRIDSTGLPRRKRSFWLIASGTLPTERRVGGTTAPA